MLTRRPPLSQRNESFASPGRVANARHAGQWLALALGLAPLAVTAAPPATQGQQKQFVPGRLLIQPRAGLSDAEIDKALRAHGGRRLAKIGAINVHVVELPAQANIDTAAAALARNAHFKFVERDRIFPPAATTNDPSLADQWHLTKIGAPTAWDTSTGNNLVIAILDSGVDGSHPDLVARMIGGWNAYDNNYQTADVTGHGTLVAGTAAATGNNAVGVASVAYAARIMPVRISDANGYAASSTIASGLTWAADNGARVANISFGVAGYATVESAAQYFKGKGGLTMVAAGNDGALLNTYPSGNMVVVSATDINDQKTAWSNYGPFVSIAAPGENIVTTARGGGYASASGTSVSSPVVAGAAAVMMAANPALPNTQIESLLYSTSVDLGAAGRDDYYGAGRVNVGAAAQAAASSTATDTQSPTVSITAPQTGATVSGLVAVDVAASDNVGVARVDLVVNGSGTYATDSTTPYGFSWDTKSLPNGTATLKAYAYDAAGNYAGSQVVSVTVSNGSATGDTSPPSNVAFSSPVNGAKVSGNVAVKGSASDNMGTAGLTLALSIDGKAMATATGGSLSYTWNTRKLTSGSSHLLTLTATDAAGNASGASISVTIK